MGNAHYRYLTLFIRMYSTYNCLIYWNPWNVPIFFIVAGFFLKANSMEKPIKFFEG